MMIHRRFVFVACLFSLLAFSLPADEGNPPPGTIIDRSPDFATTYIGSPSLAVLPDGTYVASHDWFGPSEKNQISVVLVSKDKGATWNKVAEFPFFWGNLFVHKGDLYLMGTRRPVHGEKGGFSHFAIRKSTDGGRTWTDPKDSRTGLLRTDGHFHTAPCPIAVYKGRIWRAMERVVSADEQKKAGHTGSRMTAVMASAPVDADLLDADNWTLSNPVYFDHVTWRAAQFIEGNALVTPEGKMVNLLRVDPAALEKAVILDCSDDGKTLSSRGRDSLIDFPGGADKFTIRFDPKSRRYWAIVTTQQEPYALRNHLVLTSSADLVHWKRHTILIRHRDSHHHAWQYNDWLFEGEDDIVFVSRTGWDGSHDYHDANYMTLHRIKDFRNKTSEDDAPWIGEKVSRHDGTYFHAEGSFGPAATFDENTLAFLNRDYVWENVPERFKGWKILPVRGGEKEKVRIWMKRDDLIYMIATKHSYPGWTLWESDLNYTDTHRTKVGIYYRRVRKNYIVNIPQPHWAGGSFLFPE